MILHTISRVIVFSSSLAGALDDSLVQSSILRILDERAHAPTPKNQKHSLLQTEQPVNPVEALATLFLSSSPRSILVAPTNGLHSLRYKIQTMSNPVRSSREIIMTDKDTVKTEEAPQMNWAPIIEHMNVDHGDSIIAYSEFYGGLPDVQQAILTDMSMEGFFVSATMGNGSKRDIMIPYEGGPLQNMHGMGKAVKVMSRKARDDIFVNRAPGVIDKIGFAPFNDLGAVFKKDCADGNYTRLKDMYANDALLIPQFPGTPPANAPLYFGKEAIEKFLEDAGPTLLNGLTLKPMRLHQKSDTEVTEIGRAWGLPGRSYSRQWQKIDGKWLLKHDYLPVNPPDA